MKEVFLALQPMDDMNNGPLSQCEPGVCAARWIHDASLISRFMQDGWSVYRCNGFQRITEVTLELKMEKNDGCEQCPKSPEPNNKRGW